MFTKTMIGLTAALVFGAASMAPAISASSKARAARQGQPQAPVQNQGQYVRPGEGTRSDGSPHSPNAAHDVYVDGKYAGSDPDPRIRTMLAHDPPWNREGR
jgi:hypothetical protein